MREVVGPNKVVIGGASGSKSGSQNLQKSVTFGATPTLCVPDNGFGENDMVGHQSDTSRPLSSNGESSRPSSSSRVKDLEYEEELEERRRRLMMRNNHKKVKINRSDSCRNSSSTMETFHMYGI